MPPSFSNVIRLPTVASLSWDDCRLLVESVTDYAIFMLDVDGFIATWNAGAEKVKGYTAAEIVGQHFSKFYPPEDLESGKPRRALETAAKEGRFEDEGWRIRKDGSRFWASVVITALRDTDGKLRGFGKVTRDLTKRRDAEERLRDAERRLHQLVDAVTDYAIYLLDPTGHVATWNAGAARLKGYSESEIIGQHFSRFYTAEDRAAGMPERVLDTVRRDGRFEGEGWRVRKDGSRFWANVVITSLRAEDGSVIGFAKVTRDLSDKRTAEEELRRSEQRFRLLVESVTDYAIYMLDIQGHITTWNSGAERMKGYDAREIIGRHFSVFFPEPDVAAGKPARELEIAASEGRFEDEGWRLRKDGSRFWAGVVVTAVRDARGELIGFAKVTRDLTARRAAEERERELLREQAARAVAEEREREVRENEERYRALSTRLEVILEGVADGITVEDASGQVVFANAAAADMAGFESVHALVGASWSDIAVRFEFVDESGALVAPEQLPGPRVLRGERSVSEVLRIRERASGREWWSRARAAPVSDPTRQGSLAISIWHDVTIERRHAQQAKYVADATSALSTSLDFEQMLSTLAHVLVPGLADWCSIHVLEGDQLKSIAVAHANPAKTAPALEQGRNYPPRPSHSQGVWNVLRTGKAELYDAVTDDLLAHTATSPEHLALLRAAGMRSVLLVPIRSRDRISGVISLVSAESGHRFDEQDIALAEELGRRAGISLENARLYTAERTAREQLELIARAGELFAGAADYEETLRRIVEIGVPHLADIAFVDVVEGGAVRRIAWSKDDPESARHIERTRWRPRPAESRGEATIHARIDDTWVNEPPEDIALLRALRLSSALTAPLRARGEDLGTLNLLLTSSGRHHGPDDLKLAEELARRAAVALAQVRLYEDAQRAARRSEEAARRAEDASRIKDEFLATVSHELRTPLNAIVGWSSMLRERRHDLHTSKGIDVIYRNAQAQARIVEDILDVSRIVTGKLRLDVEPVNLVPIVVDSIEVVRASAAAKRIIVEFDPPNDLGSVMGDPERLRQVVWNLLSNAVKFTDSGGRIVVSVLQKDSAMTMSVSDTGRGIDPEFLPHVFDRFSQADSSTTRRFGGLGLGLAIVRHIVELHGGSVRAESAGLGQGARFKVTLPIRAVARSRSDREPTSGPRSEQPPKSERRSLASLRVLVVDDDPDARELLRDVLAEAGAVVEAADSAATALEAVRRFRPNVVVSDVGMPDEDGYSFMRRLRSLPASEGADIPSIALTAYTRGEDRKNALAAGFTTHVGKPVNAADLIAAVAKVAANVQRS